MKTLPPMIWYIIISHNIMIIKGDFTTNIHRALKEIDPEYLEFSGLVIGGSHTPKKQDIEDLLEAIQYAREESIPFLGICFGMQMAAIEFARNVLHIENATSAEWDKDGYHAIIPRRGLKIGHQPIEGGGESFWTNFYVHPDVWDKWQDHMPVNFFVTEYHPEYESFRGHEHLLLTKFLQYAKEKTMVR